MTDRISSFQSSPATTFVLEADLISQSVANNTSVVRVYLRAINGPGGSTGSFFGGAGSQTAYVNGVNVGSRSGNPFLSSGVGNGAQRWRVGPFDRTVSHNSAGYATITLQMGLSYGNVNTTPGTTLTLPRIPKVPTAPGINSISHITPSSARVNGTVPADNMGSGVVEYQFQAATNSAFTTGLVTVNHNGQVLDVTGLTPGQLYYFRLRARNGVGWSGWSGALSAFVGLPAPTLTAWYQNSAGALAATWSAPSTTTGIIGYRVQIARDAGFTLGVQNFDTGNVLTYAVPNLAGGRIYYARVAARTAGGINAFSGSLNTMLVLSAGDLNGWTRVGTKPANIAYYTAEGLRRGTTGTSQALWLESIATGAATLAADTFGIQRTFPGLSVGKTYRFEAYGSIAGAPVADTYRISVVSEANGDPVEVRTNTGLPYVDFVADATTVVVRIMLAETVTIAAATDEVERVAFHGLKLTEATTDYPQRLRETVYESNLANHLDLACNSVGASWYVGADGVTRFRLPGSALPVTAVFTDQTDDTALHYIDVHAAFDVRSTVNRLEVTNYGIDAERENEENDELVVTSDSSIAEYGVLSERLETNLWSEAPYDESLADRLASILDARDQPDLLISSLVWNAQEDLAMAAVLDVGQRITVRFNGDEQDSQIVSIQHNITPERWLITLTLIGVITT